MKGVNREGIMSLFKKKDSNKKNSNERIIVKSGKNDYRSYPKPGTLLKMDLQKDDAGKCKTEN